MGSKPVLCPKYRGKSIDSDVWYEGYYFEMPETTYCVAEHDGESPKIRSYIIFHQMTDWGLPNKVMCGEVDPQTVTQLTKSYNVDEQDIENTRFYYEDGIAVYVGGLGHLGNVTNQIKWITGGITLKDIREQLGNMMITVVYETGLNGVIYVYGNHGDYWEIRGETKGYA